MASGGRFIGGIKFGISMATEKFNRQANQVRGQVAKVAKSFKVATFAVTGLGGALSTAAFAKGIQFSFKAIDDLAKASDKLGIATERLAGLRVAAEQTGVQANVLDTALQRMVRRVSEASIGTGAAKKALEELGLSAKQLATLAPDQQFRRIADAMEGVRTQGDKVRLAMSLFDTEGVALVNTLKGGSAALDEFQKLARVSGLTLSREAARGVENALDAYNRLSLRVRGIMQNTAAQIAPVIEGINIGLTNFVDKAGGAQKVGRFVGDVFTEVAKRAGDAMQSLAVTGIDAFAELKQVILDFRRGRFAEGIGLGFKDDAALLDARVAIETVQRLADRIGKTPVSETIERLRANALKSLPKPAPVAGVRYEEIPGAKQAVARGLEVGARALGVSNFNLIQGLSKGIAAIASAPQAAAQRAGAVASSAERGLLRLNRVDTLESARQRARTQRQFDRRPIEREQLKELQEIKRNTKPRPGELTIKFANP